MSVEFIILILVLLAGFASLFWFLTKKTGKTSKDEQSLLLLQNQMNEMMRTLDSRLGESTKAIQQQFGHSAKIITDVTERLTKLDETNKQVVSFADQLQNLQDILKNPKQRGVLGEYLLKTILENHFPPGMFKMQYAFSNGEAVDAVIFIKDKIVPIDSKFSLENYNRFAEARNPTEKSRLEKIFVNDLKNRIVETSKYIRPAEKTTDFAFMFVPHEAVYYDLLSNKVGELMEDKENLIQRAAGKYKVVIVSPTSLLAYLLTVLEGLKAFKIEEQAQEIIKRVGELGRHVGKYEKYMKKVGVSLGTTVSHYNTAHKELGNIDKDVLRITGEKEGIEPFQLEKPKDPEELEVD